jgi:ATP-dependent DNA helicase RecG
VTEVADPLAGSLRGLVGDRTAKVLDKGLGLRTVGDLLAHLPRRYAERGELTDLSSLRVDDDVTVVADVMEVTTRPMRHRRGTLLEVVVGDGRGRLTLTFFNQAWRGERDLVAGRRGLFSGKVGEYRGKRQLAHPEYLMLDGADEASDDDVAATYAQALIPVYPATATLPSWKVAQCIRVALDSLPEVPDPLPAEVRARHDLVGLTEAFRLVHRPETRADVDQGLARLRFDEAFVLQVVLAQRRLASQALPAVPRPVRDGGLLEAFDARLPFALTAGQRAVCVDITADLAAPHPMHRLLQGEVGSGKTVVALRAMLLVVDAGGQAAMLAPTEVLAQQHHRSIEALLGPLAHRGRLGGDDRGTRVVLLTGSQPAAARRQALLDLASGDAGIVVGTHALLQEHVDFLDLGLVVVDEQHRFGVEQRDALRAKAQQPPHVLVMTATPIPRTVAMTVFGDLEVSTLTELPAGRPVVTTHVVPAAEKPHYVARAWDRVREEVEAGHQAYVVCPRIGGQEADADDLPEPVALDAGRPPVAVVDLFDELTSGPLAGLRVGILHGQLSGDDKDAAMSAFAAGDLDVLVATTVVEVGVDVPNATVMVVMDADRFGVSQLHQLRGRIGRGAAPGLCLLVTESEAGSLARERLDAVAATQDGFALSRLDLEQRREGDVLGTSQAGLRSSLRVLRVVRDEDTIVVAREEASTLVAGDPELAAHPELARAVDRLVDADRADYLEKT